jgi:NAD(P)H-hydrate repair Nnr-like enzyme with NAD(P)H-hydrate epimerase domain
MRIVDKKEMKEIETLAEKEFHFHEDLIVENVGRSGAKAIIDSLSSEALNSEMIFLIGKGNNGADGLAIARHLSSQGINSRAFLLFSKSEWTEELTKQVEMAEAFGVKTNKITELNTLTEFCAQLPGNLIFIDAYFWNRCSSYHFQTFCMKLLIM